jgi:hypothetical protein
LAQLERERLLEEDKKRYLEALKKSGKFRKYVLDGIFRKHIEQFGDITKLDDENFEELGKKLMVQKLVVIKLKEIMSELE